MLTGENLEQTPADEAELIQTAAGVAAEIALHGQEVMRYSASVEYSDHWIFNRLLRKQGVKPTYVRWLEYLDNARRTIENYTSFQKIGECARDILKQHSERPPVLYQKEVYEAIGGLLGYPEPMVWDEWRKVWNEKV
jgi:Tat protein secretion system quality control protein TatD with DNase activity